MNLEYYPIQDYGPVMKGMTIGGLGILHVFLAQMAIGGGMLLCYFEWLRRRGRARFAARFIDGYFQALVLVSFVLGALTGVAMWFTAIQVSPRTIGVMVNEFHWIWATEWTFFCVEVVSGYAFLRYKDRLSGQGRMILLAAYSAAAWFSLFWINGILSFQLTPGPLARDALGLVGFLQCELLAVAAVPDGRGHGDRGAGGLPGDRRLGAARARGEARAHRPGLAVPGADGRDAVSGRLVPGEHAARQPLVGPGWQRHHDDVHGDGRRRVALDRRLCPGWALVPQALHQRIHGGAACAPWHWRRRPGASSSGRASASRIRSVTCCSPTHSGQDELASLRTAGSVTNDPYPLRDADRYPSDQLRLGAKVFRFQCSVCHTCDGANGLLELTGTWTIDQKRLNIAQLQRTKPFMPPFAGTAAELEALVQLLTWWHAGTPPSWPVSADPATIGQIQAWLDEVGTTPGIELMGQGAARPQPAGSSGLR